MSLRIVINGKEVESPIARFFIGLLAVVLLTLFGVVFVLVILPFIGITLVFSFSLFVAIVLAAITSFLAVLAGYQYQDRKKRLVKKHH